MFKIGDKVWYAGLKNTENYIVCPDCLGKKYLTVILGDDSQVTIECENCKCGFEGATGKVCYSKYEGKVGEVTICGIEITANDTRYKFDNCIGKSDRFFEHKALAEAFASRLVDKYDKEELDRLKQKHDYKKSWAWNVHYYRDCIRRNEKEIERLKQRLDFAKFIEKI